MQIQGSNKVFVGMKTVGFMDKEWDEVELTAVAKCL